VLQRLLELVAPAICVGCDVEGAVICVLCLNKANSVLQRCAGCNTVTTMGVTCSGCREMPLAGVWAAVEYVGPVREAVLRLKFERARTVAAALADTMMERCLEWPKVAMVTAVPVAPARYRERGYNQTELIARRLAERLALPYLPLLARVGREHQMGQNRADRLAI
jgi:predicted amidophosphoribosyltransferase